MEVRHNGHPISNMASPASMSDIVTKSYVDYQFNRLLDRSKQYANIHDPQFAEIEQILAEVGVKCWHVSAYANEFLIQGTTPQTAQCIAGKHRILANIINGTLTVSVDLIGDMFWLPGLPRMFNLHSDFFLELARYLKEEKVLSLPKYWLVRLKLWWNK